jgi:small subunit ribosomal protein S18
MRKPVNRRRRVYIKRKVCRFCADKTLDIDYKNPRVLRHFITERGKIIPRRISGNCAKHQREITTAIKRARNIAILPFTTVMK